MISNIFGKTKPINFIIIIGYLILYFVISAYLLSPATVSLVTIALNFWTLTLLVFTVFLINFMDRKNSLSKNNTYVILLFALCLSLFPQIFIANTILLAHIFVLLAIRSLLSLREHILVKQKLFDASFWICIAVLFYSWAVLYFVMIYIAVMLYTSRTYKNWLIPLLAAMAVLLLRYTYFLWFEADRDFLSIFQFKIQWPGLKYSATNYFLPFVFLAFMSLVSIVAYIINTVKKRIKRQLTSFLIIVALITGICTVLLFGNEEETTLIFILFPISVLVTNYVERIKKPWIKESFFWVFLLLPVVFLFLRLSSVR